MEPMPSSYMLKQLNYETWQGKNIVSLTLSNIQSEIIHRTNNKLPRVSSSQSQQSSKIPQSFVIYVLLIGYNN